MDKPDPHPIKVKITKAQNMFYAAFAELEDVRRQLGDQEFSKWCLYDLHYPATALTKFADTLEIVDAKVTKDKLAGARKAEQMRKAQEREASAAAKTRPSAAHKDEIERLKAQIAHLETEIEHLKAAGAGYISPADKARQAIKANPHRSDRDIATEIGVSHMTVFRARHA